MSQCSGPDCPHCDAQRTEALRDAMLNYKPAPEPTDAQKREMADMKLKASVREALPEHNRKARRRLIALAKKGR